MSIKVAIVAVVLLAILCLSSLNVSAFKEKGTTCPPGERPFEYMFKTYCQQCVPGYYCPDGKNMLNCPENYISHRSAIQCTPCPSGMRVSEWRDSCLARDTPKTSHYWFNQLDPLTPSPDGVNYFYTSANNHRFYKGETRKFEMTLDEHGNIPNKNPITIYMSMKSGAPGPNNYDIMSKGVTPSITFTQDIDEYQPVYFSIPANYTFYLF